MDSPELKSSIQVEATKRATFLVIFDYWAFIPFAFLPLAFSKKYVIGMIVFWIISAVVRAIGLSPYQIFIKIMSLWSPKIESSEGEDTKYDI
ncbi:TPA: hypothetical protein I7117_15315 [Vibrio vulnificus]|nr:hypothetical protein [Vibrio vulnificus]